MNALWWSAIVAVAVVLLGVLLLQWVRYRRKLHEMRRQLVWSEASRFAAEADAHESHARLKAMTEPPPDAEAEPAPELPVLTDANLPVVDLTASGPSAWADTLPMSARLDGFKATEPASLHD